MKDKQGNISTTLYRKPCWKNALLHFSSMHPRFVFSNIVKGQYLRIMRICKEDLNRQQQLNAMYSLLSDRDYPVSMLSRIKEIVMDAPGDKNIYIGGVTSHAGDRPNTGRVIKTTFITRYTNDNKNIIYIINKNWQVLIADPKILSLVGNTPSFTYRNSKNLKIILCTEHHHDEFNSSTIGHYDRLGTYPCNKCNMCKFILKEKDFVHPTINYRFKSRFHASCEDENLIYLATCTRCSAFYIGMTSRKLKNRMYNHIYDIKRNNQQNALAKHISSFKDHIFEFRVLQLITKSKRGGNNKNHLESIELCWIFKLRTHIEPGLNKCISVKTVLIARKY